MRLLGFFFGGSEIDPAQVARSTAFFRRLAELGWVEGHNYRVEKRFAEGDAVRMRTFANQLVALRPDVIVAAPSPAVAALLAETRTLPIVFTFVADPVAVGFVESLARPGGNATGFTVFDHLIATKWVELLKELAPGVNSVTIIHSPSGFQTGIYIRAIEAAALRFAIRLNTLVVNSEAEIKTAIEAMGREAGRGLIAIPDAYVTGHRASVIAAAALHRVPAVYSQGSWAKDGGLMSYGADDVEASPRAASYVDRILRGEKAGDLPVQQPNKFELVINMKTAKALGLTVPPTLLARADEVIE
jgi:putative ABC transport system substrate-binding protein